MEEQCGSAPHLKMERLFYRPYEEDSEDIELFGFPPSLADISLPIIVKTELFIRNGRGYLPFPPYLHTGNLEVFLQIGQRLDSACVQSDHLTLLCANNFQFLPPFPGTVSGNRFQHVLATVNPGVEKLNATSLFQPVKLSRGLELTFADTSLGHTSRISGALPIKIALTLRRASRHLYLPVSAQEIREAHQHEGKYRPEKKSGQTLAEKLSWTHKV